VAGGWGWWRGLTHGAHCPWEGKRRVLMMLVAVTTRTRLRLQEKSVEHREACFFPMRVTRWLYRTLGELCVNGLSSYPSSSNLQNKINLLCALNLTKWLSSTRCV
jgi:hypothetical protein